MIDWHKLSENPNAISILEDNINKIDWNKLTLNPNPKVISIVEQYYGSGFVLPDTFWYNLSANPNAIPLLTRMQKVDWRTLSKNPNPEAISMIDKHLKANKKNINDVDWEWLSENPNAISILENYIDHVDWYSLSMNPNAIPILEKNIQNIHEGGLSQNPNVEALVVKLDYPAMKMHNKHVNRESVERVFRPERVTRMSSRHGLEFSEYLDQI
jgi:hypothetical protein